MQESHWQLVQRWEGWNTVHYGGQTSSPIIGVMMRLHMFSNTRYLLPAQYRTPWPWMSPADAGKLNQRMALVEASPLASSAIASRLRLDTTTRTLARTEGQEEFETPFCIPSQKKGTES